MAVCVVTNSGAKRIRLEYMQKKVVTIGPETITIRSHNFEYKTKLVEIEVSTEPKVAQAEALIVEYSDVKRAEAPPAATGFKVNVVQTGGFAGVNMDYQISADGSFEMKSRRRSAKGKLDEKTLKALAETVRKTDWAKIPKTLRQKNTADDFHYVFEVTGQGKTHRIVSDGISAQKVPALRQIIKTLGVIQRRAR